MKNAVGPVLRMSEDVEAIKAASGLATMLSELPEIGRDADTTMAAARAARERVLSDAGVLAALV